MRITNKEKELVISIPKGLLEVNEIQEFLDLLVYKTLIKKSQASKEVIARLADEINTGLGNRNKGKSKGG